MSFFLKSLLCHSKCNYRLISNNCDVDEENVLRTLCENDGRLSFIKLPTINETWPHGLALDYLYLRDNSEFFCFMDSDIFATDSFLSKFLQALKSNQAVFSGSFLWLKRQDEVLSAHDVIMAGRHNRTAEGLCLGSSFFAIYNRQALETLRKIWQITWQKQLWLNITPRIQEILTHMELQMELYDTGKIANLLLLSSGRGISFIESSALVHIGSISTFKVINRSTGNLAKSLESLRRWAMRTAIIENLWFSLKESRVAHISRRQRAKRHKHRLSGFFASVLFSLAQGKAIPSTPELVDEEILENVERALSQLISTHQRFGNKTHDFN